MSPAAADATGRPGGPDRPEGPGRTSRSGRPERRPVDEHLMATGTILDSIVETRTTRIPELHEQFGHLLQTPPPRSPRSFADALRTRSGEGAAPRPALIMKCKAASPSRGTIRAHSVQYLEKIDRRGTHPHKALDHLKDRTAEYILCF